MEAQLKKELFFALKFGSQMLSKYYDKVTLTMGMLLILQPFWIYSGKGDSLGSVRRQRIIILRTRHPI
jgi:hypothetical protein